MSMATTRALTAARRSGLAAVLSSCSRRGGARGFSHGSAQRRREDESESAATDRHVAAGVTAVQVEAALNRKNVEVVHVGEGDPSATLLPDDAAEALAGVGVGAAEADEAWVPDQETGVFVPADEAACNGNGNGNGNGGAYEQHGPSVLDQVVFVREEDMEDVERPPIDIDTGAVDADAK